MNTAAASNRMSRPVGVPNTCATTMLATKQTMAETRKVLAKYLTKSLGTDLLPRHPGMNQLAADTVAGLILGTDQATKNSDARRSAGMEAETPLILKEDEG